MQHQLKLWQHKFVIDEKCKNLGKVGAAPIRVMAAPLEMCTPTHSRELAQVTSRDVPSRELAPNISTDLERWPIHWTRLSKGSEMSYKEYIQYIQWLSENLICQAKIQYLSFPIQDLFCTDTIDSNNLFYVAPLKNPNQLKANFYCSELL